MRKIIGTILSGGVTCLFEVAPAFSVNNDPGINQMEVNQQNRASRNNCTKKHNDKTANVWE